MAAAVTDWASNQQRSGGGGVQWLLASLVHVIDELDVLTCSACSSRPPAHARATQTDWTAAAAVAQSVGATQTAAVQSAEASAGTERCELTQRDAQTDCAGVGTRWITEAGAPTSFSHLFSSTYSYPYALIAALRCTGNSK